MDPRTGANAFGDYKASVNYLGECWNVLNIFLEEEENRSKQHLWEIFFEALSIVLFIAFQARELVL